MASALEGLFDFLQRYIKMPGHKKSRLNTKPQCDSADCTQKFCQPLKNDPEMGQRINIFLMGDAAADGQQHPCLNLRAEQGQALADL